MSKELECDVLVHPTFNLFHIVCPDGWSFFSDTLFICFSYFFPCAHFDLRNIAFTLDIFIKCLLIMMTTSLLQHLIRAPNHQNNNETLRKNKTILILFIIVSLITFPFQHTSLSHPPHTHPFTPQISPLKITVAPA